MVEAIESTDPERCLIGVQWHPERMSYTENDRIAQYFVHKCSEFHREKEREGTLHL